MDDGEEHDDAEHVTDVRDHGDGDVVRVEFQPVSRVRRRDRDEDGQPRLLRRDFDTVDGGQAGVHFLSLQREIEDFERVRDAMNGWWLRDEHADVTDRSNNGILEFITVVSRANFYVPPRDKRAFPSA